MYIQLAITKKNKYLVNSREGGGNSPALDRFVTSIENPSVYCVVFVKMCCLMFYREPCLTQASLAEQYLMDLYSRYWSRPCRGREVHRPGVERRTVCGVRLGKKSRVAGGSSRCTEYTPHRYTICDWKHSVGYCMF